MLDVMYLVIRKVVPCYRKLTVQEVTANVENSRLFKPYAFRFQNLCGPSSFDLIVTYQFA